MPTHKEFQARGRIHREGHPPCQHFYNLPRHAGKTAMVQTLINKRGCHDHIVDAFKYSLFNNPSTENQMNKYQRDSGIAVAIGMAVYAYESGHSNSQGRHATLVGLVPVQQRKDSKIIIVCYEDTGNIQRVAKVERINTFRTETWPITFAELVNATSGVYEKTNDVYGKNVGYIDCEETDKPKPRPNNKPENVKAFKTTDDSLHATQGEADVAQLRLDFYEWGEGKVHETFRCSRAKLLKFLIEHRTDVAAFLRRAGKIEKDSEA